MLNSIIDLQRAEGSDSEPVTRAQAKTHCLVDHTNDDTYFDTLITQCRKAVEDYCGISITEKSIVLVADWRREQRLPYPPVKAISDIKVKTGVATGGSAEWETPNTYATDGGMFDMSGCYRLKIIYTTGMTTVPENMKLAILNEIAFRYENRGDQTNKYAGENIGLSAGAKELLNPFIDYSWA